MLKDNVAEAEIMWCLQAISSHKSLRSADLDAKVFPTMFPDSEIAKGMQLGRTKMAYLIVHGISPFCQKSLLDEVVTLENFVIGFDESLNKVAQQQQMDLNIRFWDSIKNEVQTRYFTSVFLGRTCASDLLTAFTKALEPLELRRLLQLSMDGPNVNKAFFKNLQEFVKTDPDSPEILNLGSCGLHAINVAFKRGAVSSGWNILEFNRALYYLFKDSPACRALYTQYTSSELFPKKFCSVRWLENCDVAKRSREIIPNVKTFVSAIEKEKKAPTSKSYLLQHFSQYHKFLPAKLSFFCTVASEMEGFLRVYQSDIPLIPFLYTDLCLLMRGLLERFVTEEALRNNEVIDINVTDEGNLREVNQIDIGIAAMSSLKKISKTDQELYLFKKECKIFLLECAKKIKDSSLLNYLITKAVTCFDPRVMLREKVFSKRLSNLLLILTEKKWIDGLAADRAKKQLKDICSKAEVRKLCKEYKRYKGNKLKGDKKETRINKFWFAILSAEDTCKDTTTVLKMVMILSHGNANMERGFSINSDCLWDNMKNESLGARRTVYDYIMANGGLSGVSITKQMILYARNARSKYEEASKRKQNEEKEKAAELARKREAGFKIKELEAKKAKLLQDAKIESDALEREMESLRKLQKKK